VGQDRRFGLQEERPDTLLGALTAWLKAPFQNFRQLRRLSHFEDEGQSSNGNTQYAIRLTGRPQVQPARRFAGTGFQPGLTGRDAPRVYLNGTILGMSKQEIDRKFDETCPEPVEGLWTFPGWRSLSIRRSSATPAVCRCG
jgi:hypothetical protein